MLQPTTGAARVRWAWHLAALLALTLGAAANGWPWFVRDRMPPGDFAGYAAQVQYVEEALLEHGRVPLWCVECYGGTSQFTGNLKERLIFPLALAFGSVLATKIAYLLLQVLAGLGLYGLSVRLFGAPLAGIVAGYACAFGAIANHNFRPDVALASALLPALLLSTVEVVRTKSHWAVVALGALAAAQIVNNWVHALWVPVSAALLLWMRPWQKDLPTRPSSRWKATGAAHLAGAALISLVLAGSQVAWVAADARHHALLREDIVDLGRAIYIHRSPFLLLNRDNVLGPWLKKHQPDLNVDITVWDRGGSYLGAVVVATWIAGWPLLRRRPVLRAWARLAGSMSLLIYWLSLGPSTVLRQVAESLYLSTDVQAGARSTLIAAAAVCLAGSAALAIARRRGTRVPLGRVSAGALGWASLLLIFPTVSLWSLCERVLPPFQMQRSPGHFFETVPFWLCLGFAAALAAIERSIARRRVALALVAAIGLAVVADYWPSREMFFGGARMKILEAVATKLLRDLPGEDGTMRVAVSHKLDPRFAWMLAQAPTGYARNWLPWQAGRYWNEFVVAITGGDESGRNKPPYPELMAVARARYFLLGQVIEMPPPWMLAGSAHNLRLWQLPAVAPPAAGYRAYTRLDADPDEPARRMTEAVQSNALLIHAPARGWNHPPRDPPGPEPFPVGYRRLEPEQIALEVDAGTEPALVFVSESHHPWWRAVIDGAPGAVVRAQYALMAVPVPAGVHHVELRFEPPLWLATVDRISQMALMALLVGAPIGALLHRRRRAQRRLPLRFHLLS